MHVICARDQLAEALGLVSSIVNQRSTNPITQNVLLIAEKNGLELRATDLELSLKRTLSEVETRKPGKALVAATLAGNLLRDIRSETVELSVDGTTVQLKAGRDRFELTSADPDEFPKLPEVGGDAELKLKCADFGNAIRKVGRSIAQEKGRYALNGVLLEPRKNGIEFCGTDGRRLGYCKVSAKGKEVGYQVILPRKGYDLIAKVIGNDGDMVLKLSENRVLAVVDGTEVGAQLVEGQFPDYRSVIPGDLDKSFVINTEDFRLALNKARHLTSVESQAVRLEIADGELTLRSRSPSQGQAEVKAEIEYKGDECVLGFDPQYILQGLDGFDSDKVTFEFKDKDTGAVMHAGEKEKFYYLVMPIDI
ncbi:MAG: DNA polymerase III subunit beta [Planctomycetes bacterium]|nr:DNA polymerase III subunit beta [Planctomycetota bacterium]MCW8137004.1 DNA polymerase III subunit beta [Planctomycetota bacterium]